MTEKLSTEKHTFLPHFSFAQRKSRRKNPPIQITTTEQDANEVINANGIIKKYDLTQYIGSFIYDQGQLGSCTANAFCLALYIEEKVKQGQNATVFLPSRLFFYYNERLVENDISEDAGADVVDGLSYICKNGICSENSWIYDIQQFATKPSDAAYTEAKQHKIASYYTILINSDVIYSIKHCLILKHPVLLAIQVFESFESPEVAESGIVPIPNVDNEQNLGGHEICIIGFDDYARNFLVQNSWGPQWGLNGRCLIPYDYITNPELTTELSVFIF